MERFFSLTVSKQGSLISCTVFLSAALLLPLGAQTQSTAPEGIGLRAALANSGVVVLDNDPSRLKIKIPPPHRQNKFALTLPTAVINVNFLPAGAVVADSICNDWPDDPRRAFEYAASIWSYLIYSTVPIEIEACWTPIASGSLGLSRSPFARANFPEAPLRNTFYPTSLANALTGIDLEPNNADSIIRINSSFAGWYFEIDGNPPSNLIDLVQVVMHELGHSLGVLGSSNILPLDLGWLGSSEFPFFPFVYERFIEDGGGRRLTDYPNISSELADAFRSDDLWFNGTSSNTANSGLRAKLYAPAVYSPGSTINHLDDAIFDNTENAMMTSSIGWGSAIHDPGPILMGILADLGWLLNYTARHERPNLIAVSPISIAPGSGDIVLVAEGENFLPNSTIYIEGAPRATQYVSDKKLTTTIAASELLAAVDYHVLVSNPPPGGGESNVRVFWVGGNPSPLITSFTPVRATAGDPGFTLTVNGRNFIQASSVTWNGMPRSARLVDGTTLTVSIPADDIINTGTGLIAVTNPAPGGGRYEREFAVAESLETGQWFALGAGIPNQARSTVLALALQNNDLYVGGDYVSAGSISNNDNFSMWDGTTWHYVGAPDQMVTGIAVGRDSVYPYGLFSSIGGVRQPANIAGLRLGGWFPVRAAMKSWVTAASAEEDILYLAHAVTDIRDGSVSTHILRSNGGSWDRLGAPIPGLVRAIAVSGPQVFIGGAFSNQVDGVQLNNIAAWNGGSWAALDGGVEGEVHVLLLSGGSLYAGGDFLSTISADDTSHIARWDGTEWLPLGTGLNGSVHGIAVSKSDVYAGGQFDDAGANPDADLIARWDGVKWHSLGTGIHDGVVNAVAVLGPDVYVGGIFSQAGGNVSARNIARWRKGSVRVSGNIMLISSGASSSPLRGASVSLVGDYSNETVTDAEGNFLFEGVAAGAYRIIPKLADYRFSPAERAVTVAGRSLEHQDFSATKVVTPPPRRNRAPRVRALAGTGYARRKVTLSFTVSDDGGKTREQLKVWRGSLLRAELKTGLRRIPSSGRRNLTLNAFALLPGRFRFCVTARDEQGLASRESCAALTLKSPILGLQ